jgi:hypothetical protein
MQPQLALMLSPQLMALSRRLDGTRIMNPTQLPTVPQTTPSATPTTIPPYPFLPTPSWTARCQSTNPPKHLPLMTQRCQSTIPFPLSPSPPPLVPQSHLPQLPSTLHCPRQPTLFELLLRFVMMISSLYINRDWLLRGGILRMRSREGVDVSW